jgi:DNA-directed RNA polymerase specialized sigma24 family protein
VATRLSDIDGSRWGLFGLGLILLCVGTILHTAAQATVPLIGAGSAAAAGALLLPRLQSVDIGGMFKGELRSAATLAADSSPALRTDEWRLQRFAWLVCGDAHEARDLVEEAMAEARARRLPAEQRGSFELRSLVAMLEDIRAHALLRAPAKRRSREQRGPADVDSVACRPTLEALAKLPVRMRIAYLLRCSWLLSADEVAAILGCPVAEASDAVEAGRRALAAIQ